MTVMEWMLGKRVDLWPDNKRMFYTTKFGYLMAYKYLLRFGNATLKIPHHISHQSRLITRCHSRSKFCKRTTQRANTESVTDIHCIVLQPGHLWPDLTGWPQWIHSSFEEHIWEWYTLRLKRFD